MADEPTTCGKGLAANAVLPERLAVLMSALATMLENHVRALDPNESHGQLERDAYEHLVRDERALASQLKGLARAMEGYRDLPAAEHDMGALTDQTSRDVFSEFIDAERGVMTLLEERTREHVAMLSQLPG